MSEKQLPVITLHRPWAQWVVLGWKTIETRTHTRFVGLVCRTIGIHASLKWDDQWQARAGKYLDNERTKITAEILATDNCAGKLIGTVFVEGGQGLGGYGGNEKEEYERRALIECDTWRYGLFLESPVMFPIPIPLTGARGIQYVDPGLLTVEIK